MRATGSATQPRLRPHRPSLCLRPSTPRTTRPNGCAALDSSSSSSGPEAALSALDSPPTGARTSRLHEALQASTAGGITAITARPTLLDRLRRPTRGHSAGAQAWSSGEQALDHLAARLRRSDLERSASQELWQLWQLRCALEAWRRQYLRTNRGLLRRLSRGAQRSGKGAKKRRAFDRWIAARQSAHRCESSRLLRRAEARLRLLADEQKRAALFERSRVYMARWAKHHACRAFSAWSGHVRDAKERREAERLRLDEAERLGLLAALIAGLGGELAARQRLVEAWRMDAARRGHTVAPLGQRV